MNRLHEWCEKWGVPTDALVELAQMSYLPVVVTHASSEAGTQQLIRLRAAQEGFAMWRNNNGAMQDETGRHIRFGLGNDSAKLSKHWKSADLIGIGPDGRFVACEVKRPDWQRPENDRDRAQQNMLNQVNGLGGAGFFCTHVDQFNAAIEEMKEGKR